MPESLAELLERLPSMEAWEITQELAIANQGLRSSNERLADAQHRAEAGIRLNGAPTADDFATLESSRMDFYYWSTRRAALLGAQAITDR